MEMRCPPVSRDRVNTTDITYGIKKVEDGWVCIEVTSHSNGRSKTREIGVPDIKSLARERCLQELDRHLYA